MRIRRSIALLLIPLAFHAGAEEPRVEYGISIIGNREAPRSLFIVPWRAPDEGVYPRPSTDLQRQADEQRRRADRLLADAERAQETGSGKSTAAAGEAARLYEDQLRRFPDFPVEPVLYQWAKALELAGQGDRMAAVLGDLVRRFPKGPYAVEAQFRRAEQLFAQADYAEAVSAYAWLLDRSEARNFHTQARYKRGWSLYEGRRYEPALDDFVALVDHYTAYQRGGRLLSRGEREVVEDTFRVVSLTFSAMGGPTAVRGYFGKRGARPYMDRVYQGLADLYLRQQRYQDAADSLNLFVRLYPEDPQAGFFQLQVLTVLDDGGFAQPLLAAKEELAFRFGTQSPYWARLDAASRAEFAPHLRKNLMDLGRHYHAVAQKSKKEQDYRSAVHWYERLVQSFPDAPEAFDASFLAADGLYELGRREEAVQYYEKAAYDFSLANPGRRAEAGFAALQALNEMYRRAPKESAPAARKRAVASAMRFLEAFPLDLRVVQILAQTAEDQYALGEMLVAVSLSQRLLALGPAPEYRRRALTVLGNAQYEAKAFAQAEVAYGDLFRSLPADAKERESVRERLAASIYYQGDQARNAGAAREAIRHFQRLGQAVPDAAVRPNAEFDIGALLIQLGEWAAAKRALEDFRARFPGHPLQVAVPEKMALVYEETREWRKAAQEYLRVAEETKDPAMARDATWNASELLLKAEDPVAAMTALRAYVQRFPQPIEAAVEARSRLAELLHKAGRAQEQVAVLRDMVRIAREAAENASEHTRLLASRAALQLADPAFQEFAAIRLKLPLEETLARKQQAMNAALRAYGDVAYFTVPETLTAATFRSAELYRLLAKDIMASERPAGLSAEELEQYGILLEEQAIPFEEQAIELHELNAQRVKRGIYGQWVLDSSGVGQWKKESSGPYTKWVHAVSGIYDRWVRDSFGVLRTLLPVRYAKDPLGESAYASLD